jgi:hypothetical protein
MLKKKEKKIKQLFVTKYKYRAILANRNRQHKNEVLLLLLLLKNHSITELHVANTAVNTPP